MRNARARLTARGHVAPFAIVALVLASVVSPAHAQSDHDKAAAAAAPNAEAAKPSSVEGVIVNAPREGSGLIAVPPAKKAEYDAEAAKNEAWRKYRESTPPLTKDPNDDSKDFPGLQTYVPK